MSNVPTESQTKVKSKCVIVYRRLIWAVAVPSRPISNCTLPEIDNEDFFSVWQINDSFPITFFALQKKIHDATSSRVRRNIVFSL